MVYFKWIAAVLVRMVYVSVLSQIINTRSPNRNVESNVRPAINGITRVGVLVGGQTVNTL